MLIQSGMVSLLESQPWVALELTSEARTDEVVRHLVLWSVRELESKKIPWQLLYPIESRINGRVNLLSPYLWMRTPDPTKDLKTITRIMGLQGMVSDSTGKPIIAEEAFMSQLIDRVKTVSDRWSNGISLGSGVRVLLGVAHSLCGVVERIHANGDAEVRIALRSRAVRLRIPVRALQHLGREPVDYFEKEEG